MKNGLLKQYVGDAIIPKQIPPISSSDLSLVRYRVESDLIPRSSAVAKIVAALSIYVVAMMVGLLCYLSHQSVVQIRATRSQVEEMEALRVGLKTSDRWVGVVATQLNDKLKLSGKETSARLSAIETQQTIEIRDLKSRISLLEERLGSAPVDQPSQHSEQTEASVSGGSKAQ